MTTTSVKEELGKAIGRIASGIYVVTTGTGESLQGMLASWVMQAGFEPPMVTIAVQNDREILTALESSKRCVINVLSDGNASLMGRFAKFKPDQFDGLDLTVTEYGVVLNETVASLSCEIRDKWTTGGDHLILLAEVVDGRMISPDGQPWVHLRKNGFSY